MSIHTIPHLIKLNHMQLSEFDYDLPEDLVAQEPLQDRAASRMLIANRQKQSWKDAMFRSFPEHVNANDVVVVNNTRVFPARLLGQRVPTGGRVEVLLVREVEPQMWDALVRPANRLKEGARMSFGGILHAEVADHSSEHGFRRLKFEGDTPIEMLIERLGQTPLPPYIKRPSGESAADRHRYQTIFAQSRGAIAAPTAGLHFTHAITEAIRERGGQIVEITLHVGYGTFEPVRVDDIRQHRVASEAFEIKSETADQINQARRKGGRVIAVGTTTTRALESSVNDEGSIQPMNGETDLTITPGYKFRAVDALLTNFHLPKSSLLLLVAAFTGVDLTLAAYRFAVENRYRFYSYGDCMLVI